MSSDDTTLDQSTTPAESAHGDATPEEVAQITSAEQIDDRTKPWFEPDYDSVPDDTSWAELGPQV